MTNFAKFFVGFIFIFGSTIFSVSAQTTMQSTDPMASKQIDDFRQMMQNELARSNEKVNALVRKMKDHTIAPMWTDKLELQNAIIVYDTKSTLVSNFKDNPVIQSSVVQSALLNVLRSDSITEADLANLQNIVNVERAKMQSQQKQMQQQSQTQQTM